MSRDVFVLKGSQSSTDCLWEARISSAQLTGTQPAQLRLKQNLGHGNMETAQPKDACEPLIQSEQNQILKVSLGSSQ